MDVKSIKSELDAVIKSQEENMNKKKKSRKELDVSTKDFLKKLDSIMYRIGQKLGISDENKEIDLEKVSDELYEIIEKCVKWGPYCTENGLYFPPNKP